ncbi:Gfo/Idh/MocA family protein [Neobacillus vireti]|uniref:Gfo/Idh/MocA family protein n=1 Tax=Neobacillus vireti TaxID=220686 RepID=UPI002FFF3F43
MITAAMIGAGGRGYYAYGTYALRYPNEISFVAVADPDEEKRNKFAKAHNIEESMCVGDWETLLVQDKFCDAILICTPDQMHYEPVMAAINKGYNILLEKPMSPNPSEVLAIAEAAEKKGVLLSVCHVLRYAPFYQELKQVLESKVIGDIMSIQWIENVGYYRQAHSFVRGNWGKEETSSSMLLQKSCHDMDMLQWLIGEKCQKVSSYGQLSYFKEENAPEGSAERCLDCAVEKQCPYSAVKWYLHERDEWPANTITANSDINSRLKVIQEGPYGRCVWRSDNDVVDHQTVNLLFDKDITVAFTMSGFTANNCRQFKIMGTKGTIEGDDTKNEILVSYFNGKTETVTPMTMDGGHMGADTSIMEDFVYRVANGITDSLSSPSVSVDSHLIVFAAEESRKTGKTVDFNEFIENHRTLVSLP